MVYPQMGKKNNVIYRLSDLYTLFYFRFLENHTEEDFWSHNIDNPERRAWTGYAFEEVCLWHQRQIKQALDIKVSSQCSTYRKNDGDYRTQIDLIIDRRDDIVNLCEIKFSIAPYVIDSTYQGKLEKKKEVLSTLTSKQQSIHLTMITTFGIKPGKHNSIIDTSLTLEDLFIR
ncbi:MAG: hypothetical protein LIP03_07595 [Bacteroidales bacterium]|nr:hypothetical protein [Bacteroidales bacterium]